MKIEREKYYLRNFEEKLKNNLNEKKKLETLI